MRSALPKLGFAGIGLMGGPMVGRLLDAGCSVSVWNRSRAKLAPMVERGARAVETPAALTAESDIVMMCLMDADAVETVTFGPSGIAEMRGAGVLVDFSTIPPDKCREFASRLEMANGMSWVDAPVSGGVPGAKAGTLAIMAGGDAESVELVRPTVEILCARFTHMGPVGAGQATKMCNQIIAGCTMVVIAEAVNFAERSGVDARLLTEALKGGFADSLPFQIFAPRMVARDSKEPLGTSNTMLKDLEAVAGIAGENGARLAMTERALDILREIDRRGIGDRDISAIIEFFDR